MCRCMAYSGAAVALEEVLFKTEISLIAGPLRMVALTGMPIRAF